MTATEFRKKHNFTWSVRRSHKFCCICKNHIVAVKVHHWNVGHGNTTETFEPLLICKACGRGFMTYKTSGCDAWEG